MFFNKFICEFLSDVQSNYVEADQQKVAIIRNEPVSGRLAPTFELDLLFLGDPDIVDAEMFVRDTHFGDLSKHLKHFVQKHACLVDIPLFMASSVLFYQLL